VGAVTISGTTYLICKKRKKKNNSSQDKNNSSIELVETSHEAGAHEIVREGNTNEEQAILRQQELENLIQQTKSKTGKKLEVFLETLLDTQIEISKGNNTFAVRQLQREAKEKLQKKLSSEEIDRICQIQNEIIELQIGYTQYQEMVSGLMTNQEQKLESQIQIPPK